MAGSLILLPFEVPDFLHLFMMVIYESCFGKHICICSLARCFVFYFRMYLGHGDVNLFYKFVAILLEIRVDIDRRSLIPR